ncbi:MULTISPECIES: hypothetical protein [unclassified Gilliamella]|jgi:hypothetical protein|nr:hypothetical protein [Gilliamella apicola]
MGKKQLIIDEQKYPIAWRFNAKDCLLSLDEKRKITYLHLGESA